MKNGLSPLGHMHCRHTMRRAWEQALNNIKEREKELTSVALLAQLDIDRHIWLSKCHPDLAVFTPHPSCGRRVICATTREVAAAAPELSKQKCSKLLSTDQRMPCKKNIETFVIPGGETLTKSDEVLKFILEKDNFQRLLEFVVKQSQRNIPNAGQKKNTISDEVFAHDCAKPTLSWLKFDDEKPPGSRSTETSRSREDKARVTEQRVGTHNIVTNVAATTRSTTPAPATLNLTTKNVKTCSQSKPFHIEEQGSHKVLNDGASRDAAVQTGRILLPFRPGIPQELGSSCQVVEANSCQILSVESKEGAKDLLGYEELQSLKDQFTIKVLEQWAEPLQQYLGTLQEFGGATAFQRHVVYFQPVSVRNAFPSAIDPEQELRNRWLPPKELEIGATSQMDIYPEWAQNVSHPKLAAAVEIERISKGQQVQKRRTENCKKRFEHTSAAAVESSRARGLAVHNKNSVGTGMHSKLQSLPRCLKINPQRLIHKSETTKKGSPREIFRLRTTSSPPQSSPRKSKEQFKQPTKPRGSIPLRKEVVHAPASETKGFKNGLEAPHKLKQDSGNQGKATSYIFNRRCSKSCLGSYSEGTSSAEKVKVFSSIGTSNSRQVFCEPEDPPLEREDIASLSWNDGGNKLALRSRPQGGSQTVRSHAHKDLEAERSNQQDVKFQQTVERLAEQFIDNAVDEISLELVNFCDSVIEQMSAAELLAV